MEYFTKTCSYDASICLIKHKLVMTRRVLVLCGFVVLLLLMFLTTNHLTSPQVTVLDKLQGLIPGFYPTRNDVWSKLERPIDESRVFYNRVPKCGGRTVLNVLRGVQEANGYQVREWGRLEARMNTTRQRKFVDWFRHLDERVVVQSHTHFVDFHNFDQPNPVYINVIREPLDHLVSFYSWLRWRCNGTCGNLQSRMTLDQCVKRALPLCAFPSNDELFGLIPFFCGHPWCRSVSPHAVSMAKRNVEQHMLVVGVVEDLAGFFTALEYLHPDMFKNVVKEYNRREHDLKEHFKTPVKLEISPVSRKILKEKLKFDYEFYQWIKARFYKLLSKIKT